MPVRRRAVHAAGLREHQSGIESVDLRLVVALAPFDQCLGSLHVLDNTIPHAQVVTFGPVGEECVTGGWGGDLTKGINFYDLKADPANFDPRTAVFTHYGVFGHFQSRDSPTSCSQCSSPDPETGLPPTFGEPDLAELLGNDLIVALGNFPMPPAAEKDLRDSGTLMHALGHNLALPHGGWLSNGRSDQDRKVNYLSVMNSLYIWGIPTTLTPGSTVPNGPPALDYSRGILRTLDETNLNESVGVFSVPPHPLSDSYLVKYFDPNTAVRFGSAIGAIDWNSNSLIDSSPVSANINGVGDLPAETMEGAEDWHNLHYPFQCSSNFND